jgi:D-sedoheptulose 7-phosphate isomerase
MPDFKKDIKEYYEEEMKVIESLDENELNDVLNCLLKHYENRSTVYVFGNGGSSATASHMVCDFNKGTCNELDKRFNFVCLNDNVPELMAIANDVGFEDVFFYPLEKKLKKEDCLLAISGSGNSKNVVKAVTYGKKIGCDIIAMTGYDGGQIDKMAGYHLRANVDDMQIAEDVHMSFDHMMMRILWRYLAKMAGKEAIYKHN